MLPVVEEEVTWCASDDCDGGTGNYFAIINSKWEAYNYSDNNGEFRRPKFPV
jgi:hypothetical protein